MTDGTSIPAGWYRDPLGALQLRWWDSASWTEHVSALDSSPTPLNDTISEEQFNVSAPATAADPEVLIIHPAARKSARDHANASASMASAMPAMGGTTTTATATAPVPVAASATVAAAASPADEPTRATAHILNVTPIDDDNTRADAASGASAAGKRRTGPASSVDIALPAATWNALNRAITEAVHSAAEPLVELRFADAPTLVIDPRGGVYWWAQPLEKLSATNTDGDVETVARPLAIHHSEAGRDWEPLIWLIGTQAQPESFDPLSLSGARFKLRRWPNLTTLTHTTDQMSMTAMLGAAYLTITELASLAHVPEDEARRLVSTFELMGLLTHTVDTTADVIRMPEPEASKEGIFSRLKARFSR
ncbi:DUF2510 domain-containing protein [Salinibacterium sp. NSLL150]|uniref:DUF2510 domain-containing protein n=1 Tax=unclassified Salinibacterium TaxID=2632331 RepID=UPI0018CE589C|nr:MULTISPECIES: DUF2510 domain-containing protein [unclassified Salinibacterium]MBH0097692.1 DUF2510 domain-containing protein [Salinibacterium sp. NSLL35]MBH0100447.1 DUF2510 domain-containing protein [Salinibacterium sp. NSLL150]MBH0103206.1 DUF2510 domain-containing protein [Salinibacterium sp. NSLL16]MBH0105967.1 DUF2510 domain-containing protein [Salinibacterium sp. NSLL17]